MQQPLTRTAPWACRAARPRPRSRPPIASWPSAIHPDRRTRRYGPLPGRAGGVSLLSDPLLRKEWDAEHAPGPVRADRPAGAPRRRKPRRRQAARPSRPTGRHHRDRPAEPADPRTQPRSSRAYTWSASEVPWWEEGVASDTTPGHDRPSRPSSRQARPPARGRAHEPRADEPVFRRQDFDVYNRSSGAAWSMAARAYFRKGDAELPRRGQFRRQGTQVVTGGRRARPTRGRAATAPPRHAATRRRARRPHVEPRQPRRVRRRRRPTHMRTRHRRQARHARTSCAARCRRWPSLRQRFGVAAAWRWLPIGYGVRRDGRSRPASCPISSWRLVLIAPRSVCSSPSRASPTSPRWQPVLTLVIGIVLVAGMLAGGSLPPLDGLTTVLGAMLVVGYIATAAVILVGPVDACCPWVGAVTVRVRIAPSPTGPLHIGTARTALFNYLFARHTAARSSCASRTRTWRARRSTYERDILDELHWLGIEWDEGPEVAGLPAKGAYGPYRQMQRLDRYAGRRGEAAREDKAYYCYCSPEELRRRQGRPGGRPPAAALRRPLRTPDAGGACRAAGRGPQAGHPIPRRGGGRRLRRHRSRPRRDRHHGARRRPDHRPLRRHAAVSLHGVRRRRGHGDHATSSAARTTSRTRPSTSCCSGRWAPTCRSSPTCR